MQAKWPWFERNFQFDFPAEKMPEIIERLRGTPIRVEQITSDLDQPRAQSREGETWSIQENVGHLADLEPLWLGRVDDILAGQETMREADLTNRATFEAGHHQYSLHDVIKEFDQLRSQLVRRLESLNDDQYSLTALHPRLRQPMRMVDLGFFVAEHDDYHLSRITYLKRQTI